MNYSDFFGNFIFFIILTTLFTFLLNGVFDFFKRYADR